MKFTEQLKSEWLKALRSGKYAQGTGQLHIPNENKYCCLGVLCHIANIPMSSDGEDCLDGDEERSGYNPFTNIGLPTQVLIGMNNEDKKSFLEIADYIETNVKTQE